VTARALATARRAVFAAGGAVFPLRFATWTFGRALVEAAAFLAGTIFLPGGTAFFAVGTAFFPAGTDFFAAAFFAAGLVTTADCL
jgi:hypothetical protein